MKSPCFFVEIFAEKRREVYLMRGQDTVSVLKGVGEQREKRLHRLGIMTVEDLLTHYPREYKDRSEILKIADLPPDEPATFLAQIKEEGQNSRHGRLVYTRMKVYDETGAVGVLWYNQPYMKSSLKIGEWYLFSGRLQKKYGRTEVVSPECERIGENFAGGRILPVYPSVEGLSQKMLRNLMEEALKEMSGGMQEELPLWLRKEYHLAERNFAIENIHFPKTEQGFYDARRRLVFEELFLLQTALYQLKSTLEERGEGIRLKKKKALQDGETLLPFALTDAQKRVLAEIEQDMISGKIMNRLVQGDVGSGKTLVAAAAIWFAAQNGWQSALLAPTEILARQHAATLADRLEPFGVNVTLLVGGMKAKERRIALSAIADGRAGLVVGTHAVLTDTVEFKNLGLAIVDEQHRFGVRQRGLLAGKAQSPHLLVMSATPIPRTLGLLMYGDLDISVLDELPPGRKPVKTWFITGKKRRDMYGFLDKQIEAGHQVYIVCPAIEENEASGGLQAVTTYYTQTACALLPRRRIGLLHGKLKPKEKDEVMQKFKAGELDVLVSTTVIEVGVDVPNATVMVIENAERFGLSALHQLRGRVGRGAADSCCILISDNVNEPVRERLQFLCRTPDGFAVAKYDLETRGPGDFFGAAQHGLPTLRVADLVQDTKTLRVAQDEAKALLAKDPNLIDPAHRALSDEVERLFETAGAMN